VLTLSLLRRWRGRVLTLSAKAESANSYFYSKIRIKRQRSLAGERQEMRRGGG